MYIMEFGMFIYNGISIIVGGSSVALFINNLIISSVLLFFIFILMDYFEDSVKQSIGG